QSRITGKVGVPLLIEASTIGKKEETGAKPFLSFQAGWLASSAGANSINVSTGGTVRIFAGARFHMQNHSFLFAQLGFLQQWYSIQANQRNNEKSLGAFTFQMGFKF
ncbi:MAG TPA: hypothetical protein VIK80_00035, partial [Flavihumibacter sp.]